VGRAVQADGAIGGSLKLAVGEGLKCLQLTVSPLARRRRFLAPFEAAAIVHINDPAARRTIEGTALIHLFGLTAAEARLAAALAEGETITGAAARFGVSVGTLRTQLKSIFAKVGVNRQQDLILRLAA
jgi:DNA-binding CsgD family transcriptional regulator